MKKNFLSIALASIIALGSFAIPAMGAVSFADINNVPWEGAKAYIQEVADAGIMVGENNAQGKRVFRPKDNLSYVEGVQLAYSLLKNNNALASKDSFKTKWTAVMSTYKIPDWAYESVSYCLEHNIVTAAELAKFYSGTKANFAPREDVCLFFGRALGTVMNVPSVTSFKFGDAGKISASAGKYIQLLVNNNIIVGDDLNNFNPTKNMNRSELAVMVSKTNKVLSGGKIIVPVTGETVKGTITSIAPFGSSYVISILSGAETKGFISDTTAVATDSNGASISMSKLAAGDEVTITYSGTTALKIVRNVDSAALKGHIVEITKTNITIQADNGTKYTYPLAKSVSVLVNELKSTTDKLIELYAFTYFNARLTFDKLGNVTVIDADSQSATSYGKIVDLTEDSIFIRKTSGTKSNGKFAANTEFYYNGTKCDFDKIEKEYNNLDELYARLYFNTVYDIYKVEASETEESENSVSGAVISAYGDNDDSDKDHTITIRKANGEKYTYPVTSATTGDKRLECELDDRSADLDELGEAARMADVTAYITINNNGKVYKIIATTQDTSYDIVLREIDDYELKFKSDGALDNDKSPNNDSIFVYDIASDAKITLDGKKSTIKALKAEMELVGADYLIGSISINKDAEIVSIDAIHSNTGKVKTVNAVLTKATDFNYEDREITVLEKGKSVKYDLASKSKIYYWVNDVSFGASGSTGEDECAIDFYNCVSSYRDIPVTLTVNGSGKVTKIEAEVPDKYIIYGKVTTAVTGAGILMIEDSKGNKYSVTDDYATLCFYNERQYANITSIGSFFETLNSKDANGNYYYANREMTVKAVLTDEPSTELINVASLIWAESK